jgi:chemotaxis protein histidine kinase CheA
MILDPEMLVDFVTEIKALEAELKVPVLSLKTNLDQPKMFEKFGQVIDRIYGTAATLGFAELATYCGTLKKTCYDCSAANNKRGQVRVLGLMETCLENLDALIKGVHDPEAQKKLTHVLHLECQKAKKLHEEVFKFTTKAA